MKTYLVVFGISLLLIVSSFVLWAHYNLGSKTKQIKGLKEEKGK